MDRDHDGFDVEEDLGLDEIRSKAAQYQVTTMPY